MQVNHLLSNNQDIVRLKFIKFVLKTYRNFDLRDYLKLVRFRTRLDVVFKPTYRSVHRFFEVLQEVGWKVKKKDTELHHFKKIGFKKSGVAA
jgi:hypothetical protein